MSEIDSGRVVETRDRLRAKLDILSQYDLVLRAQLEALDEEDLARFSALGEQRDELGERLTSVDATAPPDAAPTDGADPMADLETARLVAEIHLQASTLKALDDRVLGALETQRGALRSEIDQASRRVPDAAVRYMEAESGRKGPERLDVVL